MRVVGRGVLNAFCQEHVDARKWIENWLGEAETASRTSPQVIKDRYATASFLSGNRVIFNVKGNQYRMEVVVAYRTSVVHVIWAGTHAEYDARYRKQ